MKRKALGTAVVLAALAVLINVFALQSATVTNDVSVTITTSDAALIAVSGGTLDNDVDFSATGGQAVITLANGSGLQPGSSYTFFPAFYVESNSADDKTITVTAGTMPTGVTVTLVSNAAGAALTPQLMGDGDTPVAVGIKIDLAATAALDPDAELPITVNAN